MFPLGTVLFPHMALPLHIFEPRYRALISDVLAGEREFGVTLITRGHEVGGGDIRSDVGTVARVLQAEELDDGRWVSIAVGTRRFRIESWLPDDPYPRADVVDLSDDAPGDAALALLPDLEPKVRRVLAMTTELGDESVPASFELSDDPEVACWQTIVVSPLNPFDAQRVLVTEDWEERLRLTDALLDDLEASLVFRLSEG